MTWNERLAVAMAGPARLSTSPPPTSSDAASAVPVGAIARVTAISGRGPTSILCAMVVVGLQSDIAEAGELGDDGRRLGVLMDGPPDPELLHGSQSKRLDVRARFIECVLPIHCVLPIAAEDPERAAAGAAGPVSPGMQRMKVTCPDGVQGGSRIQIDSPSGDRFAVTVPAGIGPGQQFHVQVPAGDAPPAAAAAAGGGGTIAEGQPPQPPQQQRGGGCGWCCASPQ